MIVRALAYVGRHGALFLAGGVLLGLAAPPLAAAARPLLLPALLVPLTIALLRLDWRRLGDYARRPALIAVVTAWLLAVSPALIWLALQGLPLPVALEQAIVLMTASSPVTMCATVSLLVGLDAALAVVAIVVATALVPLTLPAVALPLLGLELAIDLPTFMLRLGWMVGAAFAANLALQAAGTLCFLRLGVRRALTIGLMTGNCNMGIVLVALADEAPFDTVMFFALGQIPMYMLPALLMPLYRQFARDPRDNASGSMY